MKTNRFLIDYDKATTIINSINTNNIEIAEQQIQVARKYITLFNQKWINSYEYYDMRIDMVSKLWSKLSEKHDAIVLKDKEYCTACTIY